MVEDFKKNIQIHDMVSKGDRILLAVSGGLDSVVMAYLFHRTELDFAIAHCNFQLRGDESEQDQVFVEQLALQLGVEFYTERFDTLMYAQSNQLSIQVAARQLRYSYFQRLCPPFNKIAIAHNSNDNFETALYNLTKGTGIAGIRGIKPVHGNIIRPLLFSDRQEIEKFATSNGVSWREDSSNKSTKYSRNRLRLEVVPVLKQINPNLEKTSLQSLERFRGIEALLQQMIAEKFGLVQSMGEMGVLISIDLLNSFAAPAIILFEILNTSGFTYSDCASICSVIDSTESKYFYSATHELIKDREMILVRKKNVELSIDGEFIICNHDSYIENEYFELRIQSVEFQGKIPRSMLNEACMDAQKLVFPLTIRRWKEGDSFQPLGMKGRKKISDFLIDEKVPAIEKRNVWVMVSGEEIVWVIGYRMSEKVKLEERSIKVKNFIVSMK